MDNNKSKIFEEQLTKLINNCNLTVSEAYYIVKNAELQLYNLYIESLYQEKIEKMTNQNHREMTLPLSSSVDDEIAAKSMANSTEDTMEN